MGFARERKSWKKNVARQELRKRFLRHPTRQRSSGRMLPKKERRIILSKTSWTSFVNISATRKENWTKTIENSITWAPGWRSLWRKQPRRRKRLKKNSPRSRMG